MSTHVRLALIAAALGLVACGGSAARQPTPTSPRSNVAPLVPSARTEVLARLNQDLGPGVSPPGDVFTARLTSPLLSRDGRVVAPVGSLVEGRVVSVDEKDRRVEVSFDRVITKYDTFPIRAVVSSAAPWALTVRPEGATTATSMLRAAVPSAVGGGPQAPESEGEESLPRGDAIVPFDAEVRLLIVGS